MRRFSICFGILAVLLFTFNGYAQHDFISIFDPLVDKTWKAEGNWKDGSLFKQEIRFNYALNKKVVLTSSKGFTDKEQSSYGNRNFGIRQYDSDSNSLKFWEYDVFGGRTTGEVISQGKDILYHYDYGGTTLTDMWEFVNDSTYNFKVGNYQNGQWKQLYLETQFARVAQNFPLQEYSERLIGSWTSIAWDGRLNETWLLTENNQLLQTAEYVEKNEVQYQATTKMEKVGEDFILFSVIKDSDPKIFKASVISRDLITFENSEYEYPNKVTYTFNEDGTFNRTISGIQEGKQNSYTFKFKRRE